MDNLTPFQRRQEKVKKLLPGKPYDTLLVSEPWNRAYLSGFWAEDMQLTESSGFLFLTEKAQVLATDFRYQEQAEKEAPDFQVVIYKENLANILPEIFASLGTRTLGFENHHLTYERVMKIQEALQGWHPQGELLPGGELVEGLRMVKEPEEIQAIRNSLALTESVLETIVAEAEVGKTEKQLAWRIEQLMREAGAEAISFPPIVASGPGAAMPHAVVSDRQLGDSETIIIDLGARLDHYCSDMTRTLILGEPDSKAREVYGIVREAQLRAMAAVRAGIPSSEVDQRGPRLHCPCRLWGQFWSWSGSWYWTGGAREAGIRQEQFHGARGRHGGHHRTRDLSSRLGWGPPGKYGESDCRRL